MPEIQAATITTHTSRPDSSVSAASANVSQQRQIDEHAALRLRQVEREHRQHRHLEEMVRRIDFLDRSKKGVDAEKDRQGERRNRQHQAIANLQGSNEEQDEREHQQRVKQSVRQRVVAVAEIGHDLDRRVSHRTEVGDLRQVGTKVVTRPTASAPRREPGSGSPRPAAACAAGRGRRRPPAPPRPRMPARVMP